MNTTEILGLVDAKKPNMYDSTIKARFLADIEGQVIDEIMIPHGIYVEPWDGTTEANLSASESPYNMLYVYWVIAQIDESNAEYGRYQNDMQVFNGYYQQFAAHINRRHQTASKQSIHISI